MQRILIALVILSASSCSQPNSPNPNGNPIAAAPQPTKDDGFLGLADDASQKIGDQHPESALRDITFVSKVDESSYEEYLRIKEADGIHTEELRDGYVYYAVEVDRDVPFPDGSSAFVMVIERFKAKVPAK